MIKYHMILYAGGEGVKSGKNEVEKIIADIIDAVDSDKVTCVPRRKNINSLANFGITWDDAKEAIRELKYSDYIKGPEVDRDYPNSDKFWVFKKLLFNNLIYIKVKILYKNNNELLVVSFHEDE